MTHCSSCGQDNPPQAKFCNACGRSLAEEHDQRRRGATLLFCDVAGSTGLAEEVDAESIRDLMLEYFHEMREAIESYGGTVEKFIGDAVVGVFGVPVAHEDDALRALRAAVEMQDRLRTLNERFERRFATRLAVRIGVNTGEVVSGDPIGREGLFFGDAVNVAARLQQQAPPGAILLGEGTYALVSRAVEAEELPPLSVKGKALPLAVYRLVRFKQVAAKPRNPAPFVGRKSDQAILGALIDRVRSSGSSARVLVLGEAGVGKSRLVEVTLEHAGPGVRVISVHCLPYGEAITYFPVVQLVRQIARIAERDDQLDARRRIESAFAGAPDAESATAILSQVLGLVEGAASADEIAWATRRLTEVLARDLPLVLLIDDLQWAEEPFIEVLTGIAERAHGPILVLCIARPEFATLRPSWKTDLRLRPLAERESEDLVRQLAATKPLTAQSRSRLLAAAGGNPLFLTELVAYLDTAGEESELPPTLEALLNARLDARPAQERRTLECASVEGEIFHRGALLTLAAPDTDPAIDASLARLLEDALVRPGPSSFESETAYRFHHLLVRDAAYRGIAKRRRADLHLRFARWLEEKFGARVVELAEIVGYHLEQVCRLRGELGPLDEETLDVGARASSLLGGAARRSLARGDAGAALSLYTRAASLAPAGSARIETELGRGTAASEAGEFKLADDVLSEVERQAVHARLEVTASRARLELALVGLALRPQVTTANLKHVAEASLTTFEEWDDDYGRAYALWALAYERWIALQCREAQGLLERAIVPAEDARDDRLTATVVSALARAVLFGPTPAGEAVSRCEELLARAHQIGPATEASLRNKLGVLEATRGNAARARELINTSLAVLEDTAPPVPVASASQYAGMAELALGDSARAESHFRRSFEALERLGERGVASSTAALLARALVELARFQEAEEFATVALASGGGDDIVTQAYALSARALALVTRGAAAEARGEASRAVELSSPTDCLQLRGDTLLDLATVLRACDDGSAAGRAAAEARECFLAKGNLEAAERAAVAAA